MPSRNKKEAPVLQPPKLHMADTKSADPPLHALQTRLAEPSPLSSMKSAESGTPRTGSPRGASPRARSPRSPRPREAAILDKLAKVSMDSPLTAEGEDEDGEEGEETGGGAVAAAKAGKRPKSPRKSPTRAHVPQVLASPASAASANPKGTLLSPHYYQAFKNAKNPFFPKTGVPASPNIRVDTEPMHTGEGYLPVITKEPMVAMPVYLPGLGLQYVLTPMLPFYAASSAGESSPDDDVSIAQLAKPKPPGQTKDKS